LRHPRQVERTLLAIPSLIVALMMGSTLFHFASDTVISTLSTATLGIPADWLSLEKKTTYPVQINPLIFDGTSELPSEETLILGERPVVPKENFLILGRRLVSGPTLSEKELKARARVTEHLGGEEKMTGFEEEMEPAFSAAEHALLARGIDMYDLDIIAVMDLTKPSYVRRLSLYHPKTGVETRHLVAHGSKSGKLFATKFSNVIGSYTSSPGLYQVGEAYRGGHGPSLRLHGLDTGDNDNAFCRAIVLHSAWYVSYSAILNNIRKEGIPRLGCSQGCPAVHVDELEFILEKLLPETYFFIFAKL
jgi:L,D-transpeptidase catalytic domain